MNKSDKEFHPQRWLNRLLRLIGSLPANGRLPMTEKAYARLWNGPAHSVSDYLPWVEFDEQTQAFLLNDGVSVGAVFELRPANVEGKPQALVQKIHAGLMRALASIPEMHESNPWVVQFYLQDEPIESLVQEMRSYAKPAVRDSRHAQAWFALLDEHVRQMSREKGLFEDEASGIRWRGLARRVRVALYRRTQRAEWLTEKNALQRPDDTPMRELNQTARVFIRALQGAGVSAKRLDGNAFYAWIAPFLSPSPLGAQDGYDWIQQKRYPAQRVKFFDFGQAVWSEEPRSDEEGRFWLCGKPTRFLSIAPLEGEPPVGVLTAELKNASGKEVSLWDELPKGSLFATTIVIESQLTIKQHLHHIIECGGQATLEASLATEQAQEALTQMAYGDRIYRVFPGVYLRGDNKSHLEDATLNAVTLLAQAGLSAIPPRWDLLPIESFLRALPMAFHDRYDRTRMRRAWLCDANALASLLPLYGRSTGTGHPGFFFFNRVGEPFAIDPLNKQDRSMTAHLLLFGPTGSGKSATANYLLQHLAAIHDPRLFIIEKGNSFGRLGKYFASQGKKVNHIRFTPKLNISLPPFAETARALQQLAHQEKLRIEQEVLAGQSLIQSDGLSRDENAVAEDEMEETDEQRDYLGEMENLLILMITGADKKEAEQLSQSDRALLKACLIQALQSSQTKGALHARPQDVIEAMARQLDDAQLDDTQKARLREARLALNRWTVGLHGHFFNRLGYSWPECDVTLIDMGILTQHDDMLAVALISLINAITGLGEKYQYTRDARETLVLIDEGHIITKNPMLAKPLVFGLKTWRKLGIWLWQATQNLKDYPDEAEVMLSLAEWWVCLRMESAAEIEHIARFKSLTHLRHSPAKNVQNKNKSSRI